MGKSRVRNLLRPPPPIKTGSIFLRPPPFLKGRNFLQPPITMAKTLSSCVIAAIIGRWCFLGFSPIDLILNLDFQGYGKA